MVECKGQVFVDERVIIMQLRWVLWSRRARFVYYSQIYGASRGGAWRWFFFCSQPLILLWWIVPMIAELDKCHFNQPGKTRRRSVKGRYLSFVLLHIFDFWTIFSSWEFRQLTSFCPCYWHTLHLGHLWLKQLLLVQTRHDQYSLTLLKIGIKSFWVVSPSNLTAPLNG